MPETRWERAWEVFHGALDREPAARPAFVDAACAGDASLRDEVMGLLAARDSDVNFLERPPRLAVDDAGLEGRRIGPYVIRRVIGRGGMGVVCDAEQDGDVQRRVALKLVTPGMESRELIARFTGERQALARMNHPNIATAYDVGVTDTGRPFFAMEYVDGRPITEVCEARRMPLRDRLALFLQVCEAVQHAHQKGIIHRDLKPSNVLVAERDGKCVPKVIDFGVAKTIERRGDTVFRTGAGQAIGTPAYMSPEQAGVTGLDIDTRADIYSLGVLLFELLAGAPPIDHSRLREARPSEIERLLFVADVPRPSQRARTATLQRELRGDLDWIVLKAMERDRERRYATVSDLAADIARYFAHEPVVAGAPTTIYRARKFVARHRTGVAVAAALALAIVGTLIVTLVQSERTRRALAVAEAERARAEQVAGFLVDLFEVSDPGEVRGNAVTAREILDQGAKKIETSLADQPDVRARIMATIGAVFRNLGLYERADALLSESLALRRQTLGPDHADVAATLTDLAGTNRLRGRLKEALAQHQEALALRQRLLGPDHADVSQSLNNICSVQNQLGDRAAARQACEQAIALRERAGDALALATSIQNLGNTYELDGKFDVAETHYRRALDLRRRELGDAHLDTARAKSLLGMIVYRQGRNGEAAALYREALPTLRAVLDPTHPTVITTVSNLALVQRQEGDLAGADASLREVIAARRARLGDRHPEVAVATNNLAFVVKDRGDLAGAVTLFAEALEIFRAALGESHANYANVLHNLAEAQYEAGDPAAARNASDALARKLKALPRTHQSVGQSLSLVGHLRAEAGDAAGAEPMLREALETLRKSLPDTHARVAQAKGRLGSCLLRQNKNAEAGPLLRDALKVLDVPASTREARWLESRLRTLPSPTPAAR